MKHVPVSLTEEMILNYKAVPPELDGWRYYRIEYGGHANSCFMERPIYLPPGANAYVFDMLFDLWQEKVPWNRRRIMEAIIRELKWGEE
jgi:hypothetical protein